MMRVGYWLLVIGLLVFNGCSNKDESKAEAKVGDSGAIKITENAVKEDVANKSKAKDSGKFYYSYNEDGEEEKYTKLDAYRRIRSPYERVQISLMASKLSKNFIIKCSPCHDDYANGVIGPSLLERDGEFIYNQLIAFKTGKKKNVLMKELVSQISDKELKSIANEIFEFNKKVQKVLNNNQKDRK